MKKALIISCFGWYDTRLRPIRECLLEKEYEVKVLSSDYSHVKKDKQIIYPECEYIHVYHYKKNVSVSRVISHVQFALKADRILKDFKPDLLYVLIPPNISGLICKRYKAKHMQTKLITDIIDLWPESMPIQKLRKSAIVKGWRRIRTETLSISDYVITECKLYIDELRADLANKDKMILHLYKSGSSETDSYPNIYKGRIGNELHLGYLGSINNIIDIESILTIVQAFIRRRQIVFLHIIGKGESKDELINSLKALGTNVVDHGAIYDEFEKSQIIGGCDLAFNMMKSTSRVGLSIKSIDYLSYGVPMINNLSGDTEIIINEGAGFQYNGNADELIDMILHSDLASAHKKAYSIYKKYFTEDVFKKKISYIFDVIEA